jgi:hypothetical protein
MSASPSPAPKSVEREPTPEMIEAAVDCFRAAGREEIADAFCAMWDAAPVAEGEMSFREWTLRTELRAIGKNSWQLAQQLDHLVHRLDAAPSVRAPPDPPGRPKRLPGASAQPEGAASATRRCQSR